MWRPPPCLGGTLSTIESPPPFSSTGCLSRTLLLYSSLQDSIAFPEPPPRVSNSGRAGAPPSSVHTQRMCAPRYPPHLGSARTVLFLPSSTWTINHGSTHDLSKAGLKSNTPCWRPTQAFRSRISLLAHWPSKGLGLIIISHHMLE